ncbi:methylaspartate mutase [Nocardia halotolerans]|uniref:Methylaspartate mutase n=1 Tax=Nocardia halotolerans TaxID=1755878 RepID=A0ABV8VH54_9NOCA
MSHLDRFVADSARAGRLVVQPRMGFGRPAAMRSGLSQLAALDLPVVGTLTVDSYTRVGDHDTPLAQLAAGVELNGYPLVSHPVAVTSALLDELHGPGFPVQVRHGTALPQWIFRRLVEAGLDATEGGPVSYCLPYSRLPLERTVAAWSESCRYLAGETESGHIESFGGCLLGQLCPPSLLVAVAVLEGCFFQQHGIRHLSLSYTQGTLPAQDRGAVLALRALAETYLSATVRHVVLYTYMGLFPRTPDGATRLIRDSARLARDAGCERLIVKTASEAWQIPSVSENVAALRLASAESAGPPAPVTAVELGYRAEILTEARLLVDAVLGLHRDVGTALIQAFARGLLDVPFCLHQDNRGATTCLIDERGALVWGSRGRLPLPRSAERAARPELTSDRLFDTLNHVARRYDERTEHALDPR